ncbi:uncharacterized protein LOC144144846 [Haemaphysalis longicornis]
MYANSTLHEQWSKVPAEIVRKQFLLYAKRSDNRCLLVLPCPEVLCESICDCISMMLLLIRSGDVELNPGPYNTRSVAPLDVESLPTDPSEQMTAIFTILKDLQARSVQSASSQSDLAADIKAIKAGQKNIEDNFREVQKRVDALEVKTKALDLDNTATQESVKKLTAQVDSLQLRVNELEDRSRRNNLLFYGIPDEREKWEECEAKVLNALAGVVDPLPSGAIERAHRLGTFSNDKCRPIIVKFASFKTKDKILGARKKLKEKDVSVSEDFCLATRQIRKKLAKYAKNQPGEPAFQLRYKTLVINKEQFTYSPATDNVTVTQPTARLTTQNLNTSPRQPS